MKKKTKAPKKGLSLKRLKPPKKVKAPVKENPPSKNDDALTNLEKKLASKKVHSAMKQAQKEYGTNRVRGVGNPMAPIEVVPTGFHEVDNMVICRGGFPRGRISEIAGLESSGKTTFFLHTVAHFQRLGLLCGFVDAEHALDSEYAEAFGVRTDLWFYGLPRDGVEAVSMTIDMLTGVFGSVPCDVVIVDSMGALRPRDLIEKPISGEGSAPRQAGRARLQEKLIAKAKDPLLRYNSLLICSSQYRMNRSDMPFAPKYRTTTSKELDHEFSLRLQTSRGKALTKGTQKIGFEMVISATKNKIGKPQQKCSIDMIYGEGLSAESSLLDAGVRQDIIRKAGSFYYFGDSKLGQGKDAARKFLKGNPELAAKLKAMLNDDKGDVVEPEEPIADDMDFDPGSLDD